MDSSEHEQGKLSPALVLLMAVACGAAVANLYYAQPLLSTIAHDFGISDGTAGLLVTASQVGYAIGLVLLVPLGDLLERRRLITGILLITALGLAATAAAPTFTLLAVALLIVGVTSVVAQILVPLASTLAAESERGRVVGKVMGGLLVGILIARTASGLLSEVGGWRLVFGLSAALMVALSLVLHARLPRMSPSTDLSYPALLRSVGEL
ncbi:MAG TPA: MFS transporter, partial [Solirubrobacteraceae bacterium]|nr:MFS transporter [Solirubrobacteraceae bacterium]